MNQDNEEKILDKKSRHSLSIGYVKFGLVGFFVLIPAIIGAIIGERFDSPESYTWTLTFLAAGFLIGILSAFLWVRKEIRYDKKI